MEKYSHEKIHPICIAYIIELSMGAFEYLKEHLDQNIANELTTNFNVLTEMVAAFMLGIGDEERENVINYFIEVVENKIKYYESLPKEYEK